MCNISPIDHQNETTDEIKYSKAHLHNKLQAPIFTLNVDCLNKIFDYLSLQDVHSIGQTCKPIQQIAGDYFQINIVADAYVNSQDVYYRDLCLKHEEFNKFIRNVFFFTPSRSLKKAAKCVAQNYDHEFKRMHFREGYLTEAEIKYLNVKFEKVESITIERCIINRKFYKQFPSLCKNLRRFYVDDCVYRPNVVRRTGNEWLLWTYPKLEHLHWTQSKDWRQINELKVFFERNPQVRSFTTDINSFHNNSQLLSEFQISLDDLTIEIYRDAREPHHPQPFKYIYDCLKELHRKGVHKRLHINLKYFNQRTLDEMPPLDALTSLCLDEDADYRPFPDYRIALPKWLNLTELNLFSCSNTIDTSVLARQLINLRRIYFRVIGPNQLMPFIHYSANLTKVRINYFGGVNSRSYSLNVAALNKEREKLKGAKRTVIYIPEHIYLQTKRKLNGTEYSLTEIRRVSSGEWGHQYGPQNW